MHTIEPFYNWQYLYNATDDAQSIYYGKVHSEFTFSKTIYNYYVHPQWDYIGSETLYIKVLCTDYEDGYTIIETIGEWNDAIADDSMIIKRKLVDPLIEQGITKFIFITENLLNYYNGDDAYYEEWYDDIKDDGGYIVWLNLNEASMHDFVRGKIKRYVLLKELVNWRTFKPQQVIEKLEEQLLLG